MDLGLDGKVVCVTGGSKGIGRASVLALLREGARVGVCARDEADLRSLVEEAGASADRLMTKTADVMDEEQTRAFIEAVASRFDGLDGLVINAGYGTSGQAMSTPSQDFVDQFAVKTVSALQTVRAAVPYLKRSAAGRVVIMNGVTAHEADDDQAAVGCARAALANLTVLLALELAGDGICVNRIDLGPILTKRQESRYQPGEDGLSVEQWAVREATRRHVPLGRMGRVEEVVPWVLMLVSPVAAYVTGADIDVAGGLGARV